jgi:integrase/recombinase XerC
MENKLAEVLVSTTIQQAINSYLEVIGSARSRNTKRAYTKSMLIFLRVLKENGIDPEASSLGDLSEDAISWLLVFLRDYSPASEQLYLTAAKGFYEFLASENIPNINLPRIRSLVKLRARRQGQRLPQFPRDDIEKILVFVETRTSELSDNVTQNVKLRALRDMAFLVTLADTGLRVHEACNLRRGDLDWNEGRAVIIGKGNKQAVVRFSSRSLDAVKIYLGARAALDGGSRRPLPSLPLFARHDKGAGKKVKPITTTTGRNIVALSVQQSLGEDNEGRITPHSFRHYFVTTVLRGSGNLKLAQELARHANIQTTQKYAHLSDDELDQGYHQIFETKDDNK